MTFYINIYNFACTKLVFISLVVSSLYGCESLTLFAEKQIQAFETSV